MNGIADEGEVGTEYYYDGDVDENQDWGCRAEEANNLFDYNTYHHNGIPEKFEFYETWYLTWEQFRAEGQEPNGTMDSNVVPPDDTPPKVYAICPGLKKLFFNTIVFPAKVACPPLQLISQATLDPDNQG